MEKIRKKKQKGKAFDFHTGAGEKKKNRDQVDVNQGILFKDSVLRPASEECVQQK